MTATALPEAQTSSLSTMNPASSQHIYRQCLEALARPGTAHRLESSERLGSALAGRPAVVAPALALADLMTPIVPVASGSTEPTEVSAEELTTDVVRLTGAPLGTLSDARLALATANPDTATLRMLNIGTPFAPQNGALLCQQISALGDSADPVDPGTCPLRLAGPGVDGSTDVAIAGLTTDFFTAREALVAQFPTGIDVLFVTPDGAVLGMPRTTKVEVR